MQYEASGWEEVKVAGGVGFRCPLHAKFDPDGPVYAARAWEHDAGDRQQAMDIFAAAPPLMHDGETQDLKRKGKKA